MSSSDVISDLSLEAPLEATSRSDYRQNPARPMAGVIGNLYQIPVFTGMTIQVFA
jgi:hypothetical protein